MSDPDRDDRLTELEIRVAFQDRLLLELREVVDTFARRLDVAERDLVALRATHDSPPGPAGAGNDPPPHY